MGEETIRAGEGTIRIFNVYLMLKKINGFLNEHKQYIKDKASVINLDEYEPIGSHCTALYGNGKIVMFFDSFGLNTSQKKVKNS